MMKELNLHQLLLYIFLIVLDISSAVIAGIVAIALRFEFSIPVKELSQLVSQFPAYVAIVLGCAASLRLYNRIWKCAGSSELFAIFTSSIISSAL